MVKSVRDRNPINLRPFKYPFYLGQTSVDTDGEAIFDSFLSGIRAGVMDLNIKIDSNKLDTINKIIPVFAPSSDNNDVTAYINFVSKDTGFAPGQKLISDDQTIFALFKAMAKMEMGTADFYKYITDQDIYNGIDYYATNEIPQRVYTTINTVIPGGDPMLNKIIFFSGLYLFTRKFIKFG